MYGALDANSVPNMMGTYAGQDTDMHALNLTTTDFTPTNTGISYTYNATLKNGQNKVGDMYVAPGKYVYDVLLNNTHDNTKTRILEGVLNVTPAVSHF